MLFLMTTTTDADPRPYLADEARQIDALRTRGVLRALYVKADLSGAVGVLDAPDAGEAEAAARSLPLVRAGVASATVDALLDLAAQAAPAA